MQTASSETESESLDLNICAHHYTVRAPCPEAQGTYEKRAAAAQESRATRRPRRTERRFPLRLYFTPSNSERVGVYGSCASRSCRRSRNHRRRRSGRRARLGGGQTRDVWGGGRGPAG